MKTTKQTVHSVLIVNEEFTSHNGQSEEFIQCDGYVLSISGRYPNGRKLYEECKRKRPDVIVSDLFLDELDLLTIIKKLKDDAYSPMVIAIGPRNQIFVDMALNNGCKYYMNGNVHEDSIINNIKLLISTQPNQNRQTAVINKELVSGSDYVNMVVEEVLVRDFGVPYSINGFLFLKDALVYMIEYGEANIMNIGITKLLYPHIAKLHNSTPSRVERNIRTAIEKACDNAGYVTMERYFGKTWTESKEKPANSLFICTVARRILTDYNIPL